MALIEHPLRRQVVAEMHLRRFPELAPPAQLIQLVRLVSPDERAREHEAIAELVARSADGSERHLDCLWSRDVRVVWERHSEASTATLVLTGRIAGGRSWAHPTDEPTARAIRWAETLPGGTIRATRILLFADEAEAEGAASSAGFSDPQLVTCHVAGGARIWSDFRIHDDGYGRIAVWTGGLPIADIVRCLQRLQELGNYRNLALLGLPLAQANWPRLDRIELALEEAGLALARRDVRDDDLLDTLTQLSADLLSLSTESDYRMSATAAYAEIVSDRLAQLDVESIPGCLSLADFTERRLKPAVRTCAAFVDRKTLLAERASQFTALLRTRIETNIENQNARLLTSMDESARMQLRLQHLVEGVSTVAISYYAIGLLSYLFKAFEKLEPRFSPSLVMGAMVLPIVVLVFILMRRMRQKLVSPSDRTLYSSA